MNGIRRTLNFGHLTTDERQQRILLGVVLLALNCWRTKWLSAGLPDYIATGIQLELIITGVLGWCPFITYKLYKGKRKENEKI